MKIPRWLNPATNPALYTALASVGLSVWQAVQVDFWAGSLTVAEVGRVAGPIVIAALVAWQRRKTTPLADPRDGNGNPLVVSPVPPTYVKPLARPSAAGDFDQLTGDAP